MQDVAGEMSLQIGQLASSNTHLPSCGQFTTPHPPKSSRDLPLLVQDTRNISVGIPCTTIVLP